MSGVVEWNQREVIERITAETVENMEIAAKMVEVNARKRLLRIRQPDFGVKYRMVLALYRLTSIVKRDGTAVEGRVGIPAGEKGDSYGFFIETGSSTAAAQPWLRPALAENLQAIIELLGGK